MRAAPWVGALLCFAGAAYLESMPLLLAAFCLTGVAVIVTLEGMK